MIATKDIGTHSHQTQTIASVLQASHKDDMTTLVCALQQTFPGKSHTCFGCGQEGHFK